MRHQAAARAVDEVDAELRAGAAPARSTAPGPSRPPPSPSRRCGRRAGGPRATPRAPPGRRPAASACGSRATRRTRRPLGSRAATGTRGAGSRAPCGSRRGRIPRRERAVRQRRRRRAPRRSRRSGAARGIGEPSAKAMALGATGSQPPSAGATARPPRHGTSVEALRPACASWMPAAAPLRLDEARDGRPRLGLRVGPHPHVGRRDPALGRHGGRLDDDERPRRPPPGSPRCTSVPVVRKAVDARVLAHRRHHDPVLELEPAQAHRREEDAHRGPGARVSCSAVTKRGRTSTGTSFSRSSTRCVSGRATACVSRRAFAAA